jgi:hypothetical protein
MYYTTRCGNYIYIHESGNGAIYFSIPLIEEVSNYDLSGNVLSISYSNGNTEVYDVPNRVRIR